MANEATPAREPGSTPITDELMRATLPQAKAYTLVLLKATAAFRRPEVDPTIWEHGRRNFALRAEGLLQIVCPVLDDSGLCGVAIFDAPDEEVRRIMDRDPGVEAGIFTYDTHPIRSFPGDALG